MFRERKEKRSEKRGSEGRDERTLRWELATEWGREDEEPAPAAA